MNETSDIRGFGSGQDDPPNRGRGRTQEKAIESAVRRMIDAGQAKHGDVFKVAMHITVSNPGVGEYIADLG